MMSPLTLWRRTLFISYKSSVCSKATVFFSLCSILTFIPPFLLAYRSNGFWLKTATYEEQPDIHFNHRVIVVLDVMHRNGSGSSYITWSTYPRLNEMIMNNYRAPAISSYQEDMNQDGKKDRLLLEIEFPLLSDEKVHAVKLLMGFEFSLYTMSRLQMDSLVYIESSSAIASNQLTVIGDVKFCQRKPLRHKGSNTEYKQDIIASNGTEPEDYDLASILEKYAQRNLTTHLDNQYMVWMPRGASTSSFLLRVHLHYPTQTVEYTPGVWQVLKMAWVQYLSVMVVFMAIFYRVKEYVFANQVVPTWVTAPSGVDKQL